MKFNPTLPLALALSVGAAGAVMAQTATTTAPTTTPSTGYTQPAPTYGQPQANATETRPGYGQTPSSTNQLQARPGQMPSTTAQSQQARPTTATPSMASRTAVNGNEQVRMAQQRLHAAGIYNGPEDGIMDPDTRAALARYQEQRGLRRSESLDPSTLASLEGSQSPGFGSTPPPPAARTTATTAGTPAAAWNPSAGAMGGNAGKAAAR
jgi:hypothetical protein